MTAAGKGPSPLLLIGGLAVVGVIIYFASQSGGSSGYSVLGPSDAVTEAALSSEATSNEAQAAAATAQSDNVTALAVDYINQASALNASLAQTQSGVQTSVVNANSALDVASANDAAQVSIANAQART